MKIFVEINSKSYNTLKKIFDETRKRYNDITSDNYYGYRKRICRS